LLQHLSAVVADKLDVAQPPRTPRSKAQPER
jgi:hypothetical protein